MTARSLRIAVFAGVAPRKLGSLEDTLIAIAGVARSRGHACTVFSLSPVHPIFAAKLADTNAEWGSLDDMQRAPLRGSLAMRKRFDVCLITLVPFRSMLMAQAAFAWPMRVVLYDGTSPPATSRRRNRISTLLDPVILARVSVIAAVSEFIRGRLESVFRLPPSRTRTIYNGVDIARFQNLPANRSESHEAPRVLTVANLTHEKGIDVLIAAMPLLQQRNARLTIVGDGALRGALEEQVRTLHVADRVEFLGLRDDVPLLLSQCDVFVHAARWQEAFGYTIAEAMAAGRPVVASNVGAIPELVQHNATGLIVPPDNVTALAEAIDSMLADPLRARHMGEAGRARATRMFSLSESATKLLDLLEEVSGPDRGGVSQATAAVTAVDGERRLTPREVRISVIVPSYNVEAFIAEALDSLLQQTFTDFEVLVIDDGSTDRTAQIVEGYHDPRIVLIRHDKNRGLSAARNTGLRAARGEYVALLDADDLAMPTRLAEQVAALDADSDLGLVGSHVRVMDDGGRFTGVVWKKPLHPEDVAIPLLFRNTIFVSIAVRKSAIPDEGFRGLPMAEDYDFSVRVSKHVKVRNLDTALTQYRVRSGGLTQTKQELMKECVLGIMRDQLRELGIEPTPRQLDLNLHVGSLTMENSPELLHAIEEWLMTLRDANAKTKRYPQPAFLRVLAAEWYQMCNFAAPLGLRAFRIWLASPVRRYWPSSRSAALQLALKCLFPGAILRHRNRANKR